MKPCSQKQSCSRTREHPSYDFDSLTPKQRDALARIAINQDGGIHPATIDVRMRRKLIYGYEEEVGGPLAGSIMTITRYLCPLPVHMAWCAWCSRGLSKPNHNQ